MDADVRTRPSLTLVRRIKASPEQVFAAWTDPEKIKRWWGSAETVETTLAEMDVRSGGRFRIAFRDRSGEEHEVSGLYREVMPHRRLIFTWAWRSTPERESLVTIAIRPLGEGAELTLLHEHFFDEAARDRHNGGWSAALDKLVRVVERIEPVRIEAAKAMRIAGFRGRFTPETMREIPAQWQRFEPHIGAIPGQTSEVAYGVVSFGSGGGFDYLCGVEVAAAATLPELFSEVRLPARSYAVYAHHGHVSTLCETIGRIEVCAGRNDEGFVERYGERYDPRTGFGDMEIWIPLKG